VISDKLLELHESENIAELLDEEELNKIAMRVCDDFRLDEKSRDEWLKMNEEAIKIAQQVMEAKSTPWPNAANVKYPLITAAVIAFSSRTYPEIVRSDRVVHVGIIGNDEDGMKEARAKRISEHMSYQLLVESPNWEIDTDKLLHILPLMGLVYRKSYFDPFLRIPSTDLCLPDKVTVNNHIKSLESARRVTHQIDLYGNDLIERMRLGIYKEYDLDELKGDEATQDEDPLYKTIEQHRFLDLDGDGYQEPYIVTVHLATQKVLRIKSRFDLEDILVDEKGKIIRIPPVNYFTDYHFIRNPDGSFHSLGYGALLYPINETVNTTINQLLDAGTLSNRQGGFISKQFRGIKGNLTFKPGEWKQIDVMNGQQLSGNIVPLPVRDPSPILLNLMNTMIGAGKELASITDIMQGNQPAQNAPATTVLALLEQGLKDQKAITKRLYRSLTKEFQKLARLNRIYLDDGSYFDLFTGNERIQRDDYADKKLMIFPAADPNISSDAQRLARAQALVQHGPALGLNPQEIAKRWVEALQFPDAQKLLPPPPDPNAPPPPEVQKTLAETALINTQLHDIIMGRELEALRIQQADNMRQAQAAEAAARIQKMHDDVIVKFAELSAKIGELAIKHAEQEVDELDGQEKLPPEQQIVYEPSDIKQIMQQFQPPAPAPEQMPAPEAAPPNPEGMIMPDNTNPPLQPPIGEQ
jgi:chaperonin GroES